MEYNSGSPIYLQVINELKKKMVKGELKPGEKMPSNRELAVLYKVNQNTAARIYREMEMAGYCYTKRGIGTFVSEEEYMFDNVKKEMAEELLKNFVHEMRDLGFQKGEIIEQIAREHLPENIGVEWSGLSYQEKQAGGQTAMVLALVFLFVFLFLAALYESWTVPIAVLLSLPIAALGAYLGVWACGLENDVYFQIGLVMLVGLAAKNAILIVEFAKEQVDRGANVVKAALHASQLRFRPILMTSLAFILGMLPMVIASGPGSASRQAIGTGVFFGMILAVTVGILLVPFFFVLIYKAKAKAKSANIKKVTKRFKR